MYSIINLRILSCLKPGERICTRDTLWRIVGPGLRDSIQRFIWGDSRGADIMRIRNLYDSATDILNPSNRNIVQASLRGLRALQSTYKDDTTSVCQLEALEAFVVEKCDLVGYKGGDPTENASSPRSERSTCSSEHARAVSE